MKKTIVFLFGIMVIALMINMQKKETVVIPKESIRFRLIANSNSIEDQRFKMKLNSIILPMIQGIADESNTISETRINLKKALPSISKKISEYTDDFNISLGNNFFPEKVYKNVTYNAGDYESLVITLGEGKGDNWWCVMFPPLCLLEAKESDVDDVTYTTYIKKIINKYL